MKKIEEDPMYPAAERIMSAAGSPLKHYMPATQQALSGKMTEILLPWPPRELHPNARVHWAAKAKAAAKQRADAVLLAKAAGYGRVNWPEGRLCVWITGYARDKRRRDEDGLLSSLKQALDGIAEVMGVDDSRFVPRPFISSKTRKPPMVRIVITEMPAADIAILEGMT